MASVECQLLTLLTTPRCKIQGKRDQLRRPHKIQDTPHLGRGGVIRNSVQKSLNPLDKERSFPVPCATLQSRLSLSSLEVENFRDKDNKGKGNQLPKSVDVTPEQFKKRFAGLPGEDWVGHLDALDTHRANKFQWSARSFYYGLLHTLSGDALDTTTSMEEDTEEFDMLEMLPDWFECEMAELRSMVSGRVVFAQLHPRTKCDILIMYIEDKFQSDSADSADLKFRFANQKPHERIEQWGRRLTRLRRKLEKHRGSEVRFKRFLQKWTTDTSNQLFLTDLHTALMPLDLKPPTVVDEPTFKAWYKR